MALVRLGGAMTKQELEAEAGRATRLLEGKIVQSVWRHRPGEVVIEFDDGTRLFVDHQPDGVELSITGCDEEPV